MREQFFGSGTESKDEINQVVLLIRPGKMRPTAVAGSALLICNTDETTTADNGQLGIGANTLTLRRANLLTNYTKECLLSGKFELGSIACMLHSYGSNLLTCSTRHHMLAGSRITAKPLSRGDIRLVTRAYQVCAAKATQHHRKLV